MGAGGGRTPHAGGVGPGRTSRAERWVLALVQRFASSFRVSAGPTLGWRTGGSPEKHPSELGPRSHWVRQPGTNFRIVALASGFVWGSSSACGSPEVGSLPPSPSAAASVQQEIEVEPRSQLLPTYPCSQCHEDREPNPQRRKLTEFHAVRNDELDHGDRSLWCYQCHSQKNSDRLVLVNGDLVTFDEAHRLCGGCHGDKGRDWRAGIHGITLGNWRGPQRRRLCTHCHDPHNPWFSAMTPEPPPAWPRGVGAARPNH